MTRPKMYKISSNRLSVFLCMLYMCTFLSACGGGGTTTNDQLASDGSTTSSSGPKVSVIAGSLDAGTASQGSNDGAGVNARFNAPLGIARDDAGNLYIADTENFTIRKIAPDGTVDTIAGTPGVSANVDGNGNQARFGRPLAIAVDQASNIYVADKIVGGSLDFQVRLITPDRQVTTLATIHSDSPYHNLDSAGMAIDQDGNLLVSYDQSTATWRVSRSGEVTLYAGLAKWDEFQSQFFVGGDVLYTNNQDLYFISMQSHIGGPALRKYSPDGSITTVVGGHIQDSHQFNYNGQGDQVGFAAVTGMTFDDDGSMYVTSSNVLDQGLRKITPDGVATTVLGGGFPRQASVTVDNAFDVYAPHGIVKLAPKTFAVVLGNAVVKVIVP